MKLLFQVYRHYAEKKGLQFCCVLAKSGAAVLSPIIFGALISELGEGGRNHSLLVSFVILISLIALVEVLVSYALRSILAISSASMARQLKNVCYKDFQKRDAEAVASLPPGEWCQRISGDCECVAQCAGSIFSQWMEASIVFLMSGAYILWQRPIFFFVLLPVCAAFLALERLMSPRIQARSADMRQAYYRESSGLFDLVELSPLLEVFRAAQRFLRVFGGLTQNTTEASIRSEKISACYTMWIELILHMARVLILILSVSAFWAGEILSGEIVTFTMLATQLVSMTSQFAMTGPMANRGKESAEAIKKQFRIFDAVGVEIADHSQASTVYAETPGVELEHVDFSYRNTAFKLIEDACMKIYPGDYIAILGVNGAGKSSLIKLILGMLTPHAGRLMNYFRNSAYVPQNSVIYHATLAENICLNDEYPDRDYISELIQLCHLDQLMQRLGGLDARVAKEMISGGESQRIGIARALYSRPDLLVVDEVTNNLDILGKELVFDILRSVCKTGCAVLSVSHDIETLQDSCCSYILHQGRLHSITADSAQERARKAISFIKEMSYE